MWDDEEDLIPITTCPKYSNRNRQIVKLQVIQTLVAAAMLILFLTTFDFNRKPTKIDLPPPPPRNPVLVWYTEFDEYERMFFVPSERKTINCSTEDKLMLCDVTRLTRYPENAEGYLFYATFFRGLPLPRNPKTLWGLLHEESPRNVVDLMHEKALNLFNFTCTFSRYSDVPMPLIWMRHIEYITETKYYLNTTVKNSFLKDLAPVMYMQTDCDTSTERDDYVKKLMEYIKVDSYGTCLRNKNITEDYGHPANDDPRHYLSHINSQTILKFIARYKFVIAIENAVCNDYVTEKFWRSIRVGVVPIYYGDPLIKDWLPNNKSAILLEDHPTPELLSKHLYELLENDTKYEEYLEHKTKGLISNPRIFEEMKARPYQTDFMANIDELYCLMCERLHDTNSSRINVANKKHYDCPLPTSALTLAVNPNNTWLKRIREAKEDVDHLYNFIRANSANISNGNV